MGKLETILNEVRMMSAQEQMQLLQTLQTHVLPQERMLFVQRKALRNPEPEPDPAPLA